MTYYMDLRTGRVYQYNGYDAAPNGHVEVDVTPKKPETHDYYVRAIEKVEISYVVRGAASPEDAIERMRQGDHEPSPDWEYMEEIGIAGVEEV